LAKEYFVEIFKVIECCYRDYAVYVDPRSLFTIYGLAQLGWTIEDIEECAGLQRGCTDIDYNKDLER